MSVWISINVSPIQHHLHFTSILIYSCTAAVAAGWSCAITVPSSCTEDMTLSYLSLLWPNNPIWPHLHWCFLHMQAGDSSKLSVHPELCVSSCGLSVWCSAWCSLSFCALGHRLEQIKELLFLPTDISKLASLCPGILLQYNGVLSTVVGILIVSQESGFSPKL